MSALNTLKLTATKKPTQVPSVVQRRTKLAKRLWKQIELAKAEQNGTKFSVPKFRSYTDKESGVRKLTFPPFFTCNQRESSCYQHLLSFG
jgi:hypothetical protein